MKEGDVFQSPSFLTKTQCRIVAFIGMYGLGAPVLNIGSYCPYFKPFWGLWALIDLMSWKKKSHLYQHASSCIYLSGCWVFLDESHKLR